MAGAGSEFDVFLSHAWGADSLQRDNHDRVGNLNTMMKTAGFATWFDEEQMTGHIVEKMCEGIDGSAAVLVFVTDRYLEKVRSKNDDNCKKEFNYAVLRRTTAAMIPIIMDASALVKKSWAGPVGMELAAHLHIDMTTDDRMRAGFAELVARLQKLGVTPKAGAVSAADQRAAVAVPREVAYVDSDKDSLVYLITPEGLAKFVNKKMRKLITHFDYRPIDGDLRDQDGWGGRIALSDRHRVISALRLMCADQKISFYSRAAVTYVDGDGDSIIFADSRRGLQKYVNGEFRKMVQCLRYNRATRDLRDQDGWGAPLPAATAKLIASELEQVCLQLGIAFQPTGVA